MHRKACRSIQQSFFSITVTASAACASDALCPARRQGGSFAYLTPAFALIAQVQNDTSLNFPTDHDRFIYTMRVLQASSLRL